MKESYRKDEEIYWRCKMSYFLIKESYRKDEEIYW